jgi:dephospho-CoA kinase
MISYLPTRLPRAALRWRHGVSPVVGLTGGIGGGKSAVASLLGGHGAVVIDADRVGHEVLKDPGVRDQIVERFGAGVLAKGVAEPGRSPAIDRRALGAIVFADPQARHDLESIVHPRMRGRFVEIIGVELRSAVGAGRVVVLDAAILLEAGWDDLCDWIVFVDAPRDERFARVASQRGWSRETFDSREQAQWPCEEKRLRADLVITNDGGMDALSRDVERAWSHLLELSSSMVEAPNP